MARGGDAERIRKHALRLEQEIRALGAGGARGTLSALWDSAVGAPGAPEADDTFADSLRRTRAAIEVDGEIVDCDAALPARLLRHVWAAAQQRKAEAFRDDRTGWCCRLSDILKADFERSGRGAERQRPQGVGGQRDSATRSTSTPCRGCLSTQRRPRAFPRAGASAYAPCSTCSARSGSSGLLGRSRISRTRSCSTVAPTRSAHFASACPS